MWSNTANFAPTEINVNQSNGKDSTDLDSVWTNPFCERGPFFCSEQGTTMFVPNGAPFPDRSVAKAPRDAASRGTPTLWARFKVLLYALTVIVIVLGVLTAALILGSMVAALVWILLVFVSAAASLGTVLRRGRR